MGVGVRKFLLLLFVFVVVLLCVAGLVAVTMPTSALEARVALDAAMSEWTALGGLADPPKPAPVARKDNAAVLYGRAFAMLRPRAGEPQLAPLADAARVGQDTDERANAVAVAREAAARPDCVWDTTAFDGVDVTRLAGAIAAAAAARAEQGDTVTTLEHVEALRGLARHLRADPRIELFVYSLLVENAALDALVLTFRDRDLPIEHAPGLLSHEDYRELAHQALVRHGAVGLKRIDEQEHREERILQDKADFLRWMSDQLRALRRPYTAGEVPGASGETPRWMSLLTIYPDRKLIFATEARARLLGVAVDLRAWEARHGEYPATWPMPADPFSGKPLCYERRNEGFVLSSEAGFVTDWAWD